MKLLFKKEGENSDVFIVKDSVNEIFNYVKMIGYLIKGDKFEDSEFEGDYSMEERQKIEEMIGKINIAVYDNKNTDIETESAPEEITFDNGNIGADSEVRFEDIPF